MDKPCIAIEPPFDKPVRIHSTTPGAQRLDGVLARHRRRIALAWFTLALGVLGFWLASRS
jgi:hypothetical protein